MYEVLHCVFFEGESVFIYHWLWGSVWGVSLWTAEGFFAAAFGLSHLPVVAWHPQDVTKLFLCSSVVMLNFAVVVSGIFNKFTGRGGGSHGKWV